jgi:hypothetical protein
MASTDIGDAEESVRADLALIARGGLRGRNSNRAGAEAPGQNHFD